MEDRIDNNLDSIDQAPPTTHKAKQSRKKQGIWNDTWT